MKITMKMQITIISLSVTMIHDVNINCINSIDIATHPNSINLKCNMFGTVTLELVYIHRKKRVNIAKGG